MIMNHTGLVLGLVAVLALFGGLNAEAGKATKPLDISISGFGGWAIPFKTDLRQTDPAEMQDILVKDLSLKSSLTYGGKLTVWKAPPSIQDRVNFGVELDITRYSPDQKEQILPASGSTGGISVSQVQTSNTTETYTIVAINFLMRWPFGVSPELPNGRWYPYVGIGGGVQIARSKLPTGERDTDISGVRQLLAGAKVFITRNVAVFGEYKNTYARHTFEFGSTQDQSTAHINHFTAGLSLHF
ncbi:outer membrane protein [Candidatus Nitrospira bockiana]